MKKFLLYILCLILFTAIAGTTNICSADSIEQKSKLKGEIECYKEISLKPFDKVKQGETVFINIKTPKPLVNPVFTYNGKKYKLFKDGENKYSGHLGIAVLEKPGKHKLLFSDKSGNLNDNAIIEVVECKYPEQNIRLTKKMSGLSATSFELSKIGQAKRKLTEKNYVLAAPPYNSPANGCIISVFGRKRLYNGVFSGNYHKGVDIKAPTGEEVRTIAAGKVIFAEPESKFRLHGSGVAVDHGHGIMSLYIHLSKINVKEGDYVIADQKIGEVGMTGFATGPHLHWGLYVNGTPVDPMKGWIKPVNCCK